MPRSSEGEASVPARPDDWLPVYEAVDQVRKFLRKARPARRPGGSDGWDRVVKYVGKHHFLDGILVDEIEQAIARAQQKWSDDQKRSLYRDLKRYVAADYRRDRDLDEDGDEIELAEEQWADDADDQDDGYDIPADYLDFVTKDGLLDAVMSEASGEAYLIKVRERKAAAKAGKRRPTKRRT